MGKPKTLPALTPDDLQKFGLSHRGFTSHALDEEQIQKSGGVNQLPFDPSAGSLQDHLDRGKASQGLGRGFDTYAVVQIIDRQGNQVIVSAGKYLGGRQPHGEENAVNLFDELSEKSSGRIGPSSSLRNTLPGDFDLQGGVMMVWTEKTPCKRCDSLLKELAKDLGLERIDVYVPVGEDVRPGFEGRSVRPKTAARRFAQGPTKRGKSREPGVKLIESTPIDTSQATGQANLGTSRGTELDSRGTSGRLQGTRSQLTQKKQSQPTADSAKNVEQVSRKIASSSPSKSRGRIAKKARGIYGFISETVIEETLGFILSSVIDKPDAIQKELECLTRALHPEIEQKIEKLSDAIESLSQSNQVFIQVVIEYLIIHYEYEDPAIGYLRLKDLYLSTKPKQKVYTNSVSTPLDFTRGKNHTVCNSKPLPKDLSRLSDLTTHLYPIPINTRIRGDIDGVWISGRSDTVDLRAYAVYFVKQTRDVLEEFDESNIVVKGYKLGKGDQHADVRVSVEFWDGLLLRLNLYDGSSDTIDHISLELSHVRSWNGVWHQKKRLNNTYHSIKSENETWLRVDDHKFSTALRKKNISSDTIEFVFKSLLARFRRNSIKMENLMSK